jgi:hypothetical protein
VHALTTGAREIRSSALLRGQSVKRANALTAVLSGALPGVLVGVYLQPKISRLLLGLAIGLLWTNGFEYVYHRYLLHWPAGTHVGKRTPYASCNGGQARRAGARNVWFLAALGCFSISLQ